MILDCKIDSTTLVVYGVLMTVNYSCLFRQKVTFRYGMIKVSAEKLVDANLLVDVQIDEKTPLS